VGDHLGIPPVVCSLFLLSTFYASEVASKPRFLGGKLGKQEDGDTVLESIRSNCPFENNAYEGQPAHPLALTTQ
jgi:hypothetical protein